MFSDKLLKNLLKSGREAGVRFSEFATAKFAPTGKHSSIFFCFLSGHCCGWFNATPFRDADGGKHWPAKDMNAGTLAGRLWVEQVVCVAVMVLLLGGAGFASAKNAGTRDARINLIRGLVKEIAVTKVALPRGKHGIYVDSAGKQDQTKAEAELRQNGPAIRPGMPVEITKITFKPERLIFEINGGGNKGKKWYQRIEVGMGTSTTPVARDSPVLTFGSWITLALPGKGEELTVQQVKQLLSAALDFERHSPTVLYSPSVPPKFKEAIKNHQVVVGMDRDAVLSAKGPPERKVREVREGVEQEDWIYGLPPHVLFVTFDGDTVASVRQH